MAKSESNPFDDGFTKYMASNCAQAVAPLYQASISKGPNKDRAHLYLAHCQSLFGQTADAAYNLDQIKAKKLEGADLALYKTLKQKHEAEIDALHKLYFNASPYAGTSTTSPSTVKGTGMFYGLSLGVSRPSWSVGLFYESFSMDMVPTTSKDYSQSMIGGQLGYFVLPTWHVSGSYTTISGSTDQLKSISIPGVQTDYYFLPGWNVFGEYYSSTYSKLVADSAGSYKFPVSVSQAVVGLGFPIINRESAGMNGSANYTSISLTKPSDSGAVIGKALDKSTARMEAVLSAYFKSATAALTYWTGSEVLGVRARGAVVNNAADLRKDGIKINLGYTLNAHFGLGASYSVETVESTDIDGQYKDFKSSTAMGSAFINW